MIIHSMDNCSTDKFYNIYLWCQGNVQDLWGHHYPNFYFNDEQDYTLFLLKWS
jgi:hypothetical protein